jgi:hypothetical protein
MREIGDIGVYRWPVDRRISWSDMKQMTIILCLWGAACGGSSGSTPTGPSSPAPAAPTLTGISVEGAAALLTGTSAEYTVTATFSNQTTQTVTATWSAGGTDRATVSPTGSVSGQLHGSFTLTASYQGHSAAKTVNVVNNYDGSWSGVVIRMTCQLNGELGRRVTARLCPAGPSARYPMSFSVSQPPPYTDVTSELNLANVVLRARGTVASDGRLTLSGDTEYQQPDPVSQRSQVVRWSLMKWDTQISGPGLAVMAGRFDLNRTESLWEGSIYEEYTIEQMRRAR